MDSCRIVFDPTCHGNMLFLSNRDTLFQGSGSLLNMDETTNKRPFFNSANDLMEEDFYDEQLPEKKRRLSPEQIELLERSFDAENKLEPERKSELARKLGMQPRQVAIWFQNRRARWKNKQLERDYDELKASFDALRRKYENLAKEKEQLKIEVISLTEKLQARDLDGIADSPPLTTEEIFIQENIKTEDRLSSGTGGSIIVDEDGLQIVDSGDSYFADDYCGGLGNVNAISEEDDGSDALTATENHHYEDEEDQNHLAWWFWS